MSACVENANAKGSFVQYVNKGLVVTTPKDTSGYDAIYIYMHISFMVFMCGIKGVLFIFDSTIPFNMGEFFFLNFKFNTPGLSVK